MASVTKIVGLGREMDKTRTRAGVRAMAHGASVGEEQIVAVRTAIGLCDPHQTKVQRDSSYEDK